MDTFTVIKNINKKIHLPVYDSDEHLYYIQREGSIYVQIKFNLQLNDYFEYSRRLDVYWYSRNIVSQNGESLIYYSGYGLYHFNTILDTEFTIIDEWDLEDRNIPISISDDGAWTVYSDSWNIFIVNLSNQFTISI